LKLEDIFKKVRIGVLHDTNNKQRPWESVSITDDFYFVINSNISNVATEKPQPKPEPAPVVKPPVQQKPSKEGFTNSLGMKFVYIPPGTFMMGSPKNTPNNFILEIQQEVTISKSFYIQTTEVTQGQWKAVMGSNPNRFKNCGDTCPVENISWDDVQEFIKKLNEKGDENYRLPTEAEWEYAARAGSKTNESLLDPIVWYGGNSCVDYSGGYDCSHWKDKQYSCSNCGTHPVGKKSPNDFGLYDILGNVSEWCQDWYGDYTSGAVTGSYRSRYRL
jgi:formylglycine-generating enzyme required for sulfatase activity